MISAFIINTFNSCAKSPNTEELINSNAPYDAIIVPGVPYADEYWNKILMGRIYWSLYLYKNGITKNIIYSGSAVYTPYTESKIMAMYASALGVPDSHIYTETKAEHSVENIYYSYQIAQKMGFKKIALATDPFQSKMMVNNVEIPADKAFVHDFVSIEERENFFQRLRGTFGKNINYKD